MSGWSEITVIKKATIEVAGKEVEIDVKIPVQLKMICELCGEEMDYSVSYDDAEDIILHAECKCMVNSDA